MAEASRRGARAPTLGLALALALAAPSGLAADGAAPGADPKAEPRAQLLAAYPDHLDRIEGNDLVWRDGTRMALDDGRGTKPFAAWLAGPDIEDMLTPVYPAGAPISPPPKDFDPGRARNETFFDRMYGDCRKGEVSRNLVNIVWLPTKAPQRLKVSRINGVAARLQRISQELDALPARFDRYLMPAAGTYNCRTIAGTGRRSAHGYGIAIDIALEHAHYWRNAAAGPDGSYVYRNEIPHEIVAIFEAHGFIWGGRWHHYDTMHFEYRPELIPPRIPQ